MRSVLQRWPLALVGSAIACGGSPPNATSTSQSPIEVASNQDPELADSKVAATPSEPGVEPEKSSASSALVGVSSPFTATFRVDTSEGGLDGAHTKKVLLSSAKKLENCAYASDFASHWTVGLSLQVDLSGKVKLVAEGAKAPLVRCLESVVLAMKFPSATEATKIDAAIMIQYSKLAETSPATRDGIKGGVIGGVLGGTHGQGGYGIGPGGGGTGYGTIGTGSYGTVGHGSNGPIVQAGSLTAKGALSRNIIRRVIRRHIPRIRFCYEKQLVNQPRLQGRLKTTFTITATGRVSQASVSGMRRSVSACVEQAIKRMQFPRPTGGGVVRVKYPFVFSPGAP